MERVGYFPAIVWDVLDVALGGESIVSYLVHPETTFGLGAIGRHLSVLVLTDTRLISAHADDHAAEDEFPGEVSAVTSAVALNAIQEVNLNHWISRPQEYQPGRHAAQTAWLAFHVSWGGSRTIDLEPADCGDPDCEADHGLSGVTNGEDIALRISTDMAEPGAIEAMLGFAKELSGAVGRARR